MTKYLFYLISLFILFSCSTSREITEEVEVIPLDTAVIEPYIPKKVFKGSEKKEFELTHMNLEVRFNWDSSFVIGEAEIELQTGNWPVHELKIDARGFKVKSTELRRNGVKAEVKYSYDGEIMSFRTDSAFRPQEELKLIVKYVAMPDKLATSTGMAIQSDKGLYFIKHGDDKREWQIWTQGETESNSAWFPTIDAPNQKYTHDIYLTVDTMYETLSNGIQLFENDNGDGTKVVLWKMEKKHAPYLTMIAVGDFAVIEDEWNEMPVNYYVEHEYKPFALDIFGNTPEMLEFYSNLLEYPYPWPKYSQVAVKDFVSGAMENTSAVVHGDFIQQTRRELLDNDYEDFIAHELFHHWFGDLITCESWANLALNESFATYGEYLWFEHKYGREAADYHREQDLDAYMREASTSPKRIIRHDYRVADEVFDAHTYQKGGLILHQLRKYLGDEKFFKSLRTYLKEFEYGTAEMSDLRKVFEEVTGEDLEWYFDQWFYKEGHPYLTITKEYVADSSLLHLTIEQLQTTRKQDLFILPIQIDIYSDNKVRREEIIINAKKQRFTFEVDRKPLLVNFDADKSLVGEKFEEKPIEEWMYLFREGPLLKDRMEATEKLFNTNDSVLGLIFDEGLKDSFWKIRESFIYSVTSMTGENRQKYKEDLIRMSQNDENSQVRAAAIDVLAENFKNDDLNGVFKIGLMDSSFAVMSRSLRAIFESDEKEGMIVAKEFENSENADVIRTIADLYAEHGDASHSIFFERSFKKLVGFEKFFYINSYQDYLLRQNDSITIIGVQNLQTLVTDESASWIRVTGVSAIRSIESKYHDRNDMTSKKLLNLAEDDNNYDMYVRMQDSGKAVLDIIKRIKSELLVGEDNNIVRRMLGDK